MTVQRFSTLDMPRARRRDYLEAHYGAQVWVALDFPEDSPVRFEAKMRLLPGMSIGLAKTSACRSFGRTQFNSGVSDMLCMSIGVSGSAVITQNRKTHALSNHGACLMVFDRDYQGEAHCDDTAALSVVLPRSMLEARVADLDRLIDQGVPKGMGLRMLSLYAGGLLEDEALISNDEASLFASHIADLVISALGPRNGDEAEQAIRGGGRAARRAAVMADIAAHYTSPEFSLRWLTKRHHIGERTLRNLFYTLGTSFTDHILDLRLQHAHSLLCDPANRNRPIISMAYEAGFGDSSWFNRAFKRRFGMSPKDVCEMSGDGSGEK